jgi:cephalosporin hydroxylase
MERPVDETRDFATELHETNLHAIQQASHYYRWKDVPLWKNPFDFALYWLLVWKVKPATIVEIGSKFGGSALWLADMLSIYGIAGRVVSVDNAPVTAIADPRIDCLAGDVADLGKTLTDDYLARQPRPWLVIEDSSHLYEHSLAALNFFHSLLKRGDYLIVEDGVVDALGMSAQFNGGPSRAVKEFFAAHPADYELVAGLCDFFGKNVTWNPNGYWRRIK